jgi:hypothetical protein
MSVSDSLISVAAATNKTVGIFTPAAWASLRRNQAEKDLAA